MVYFLLFFLHAYIHIAKVWMSSDKFVTFVLNQNPNPEKLIQREETSSEWFGLKRGSITESLQEQKHHPVYLHVSVYYITQLYKLISILDEFCRKTTDVRKRETMQIIWSDGTPTCNPSNRALLWFPQPWEQEKIDLIISIIVRKMILNMILIVIFALHRSLGK